MLYVRFEVKGDRYLVDVATIVEVVPCVKMKAAPQAPRYIAGIMNYRGECIPVIDASMLLAGEVAQARLGTRILVCEYTHPTHGGITLGVLVENALETLAFNETDFQSSGIEINAAGYLGKVAIRHGEMYQEIALADVLPEDAYPLLFAKADPGCVA
ncbi:MAG: chemotaxis protein CheW [Pseudomonadota bacterium]